MRASIIVLSYNSLSYLGTCLQSIVADMGEQDELIVVDNGSVDGSSDFVLTHYPQAQLIRSQNIGYAGGNNLGAAAAQGEYLVFLNPDIYLQPGSLSFLLSPLERRSDIALTTPCVVFMRRPEVINTCGNTIHYTGLTYCRGAGRSRMNYPTAEVDAVSGAAFAIRRSVFEELGGFDRRFFMYVEDTDLSWRARLAGYRCLYVAEAVIQHDYSFSYSPAKAYYLDRNRHFMLLKNLSTLAYTRMLPGLLASELVTWGFLLLKGPRYWGVKLRVYSWLWKEREMIRQSRQDAQTHGRMADLDFVGRMTPQLDFEQLASPGLARLAALIFHPVFKAARELLI